MPLEANSRNWTLVRPSQPKKSMSQPAQETPNLFFNMTVDIKKYFYLLLLSYLFCSPPTRFCIPPFMLPSGSSPLAWAYLHHVEVPIPTPPWPSSSSRAELLDTGSTTGPVISLQNGKWVRRNHMGTPKLWVERREQTQRR